MQLYGAPAFIAILCNYYTLIWYSIDAVFLSTLDKIPSSQCSFITGVTTTLTSPVATNYIETC